MIKITNGPHLHHSIGKGWKDVTVYLRTDMRLGNDLSPKKTSVGPSSILSRTHSLTSPPPSEMEGAILSPKLAPLFLISLLHFLQFVCFFFLFFHFHFSLNPKKKKIRKTKTFSLYLHTHFAEFSGSSLSPEMEKEMMKKVGKWNFEFGCFLVGLFVCLFLDFCIDYIFSEREIFLVFIFFYQ